MAVFDSVIEDVAGRFGLGEKAGPLLHEVVQLMTSSPGGIGGFIDKLKSAGLSAEVRPSPERHVPGDEAGAAPAGKGEQCRAHDAASARAGY